MSSNNIEIEIKLPLINPQEVREFLNTHAKLVSENIYQKDTYFVPHHRDFLAEKYPYEWLRLRQSSKDTSINYKHFHPENVEKTDYCDELETKIADSSVMENMLKSLDFKEVIVVEKSRTTWLFEAVEIVVDEVSNLGSYIELEATKHFENPLDGRPYLFDVLKKLNAKVGEEDLRGYPFRMLEKKGHKQNSQ